jgi:diguanylate cyclase (GGDEF)-like protein
VRALTKQITDIKASRNFATELHVSRDIGEVGQLVDSFASLMSDIRFRDESLQKLAYFDPITGLANHASLLNKIGELGTDVGAAIAIFNIRGFRTLTNAFGRTIGDAIILSVAAGIRENANGAFVARLGAHEFAVLATGVWSQSDAEKLVAPIMAAFMRPMAIMSSEITIDLDCGVALSPSEPDGSKDLVRCASLALFEAGSLGPNRTVFYQHNMQEKALLEAELRQELKHALAVRELEVHYQPQVEARTGIVTGFEALARWKHAVRGYVPPSVFIPIAEDSGLIAQIGDWVLDESCRQTAEWFKQSGVFYAISVNVSASQLMDSTFVLKVKNALARHGLPSQFLCLEVTESIFAGAGMAELVDSLGRLRDMDVKLALDDFGTGYSSLDYLAKMPLHTIKIDRSFVAEAQQSSRRTSMLSSIIGMCQGLGLDTVAEGAETPEDIALLQQLKVDKIQGYGIAKPMRAEEALAFANSYHQGSPTRAIA